jgi:hypothetical protein
MAKPKKSKRELADMIAERLGVGGVQVAVYKCPIYGWDANVITAPTQVVQANGLAKQAAAELREQFELADEPAAGPLRSH